MEESEEERKGRVKNGVIMRSRGERGRREEKRKVRGINMKGEVERQKWIRKVDTLKETSGGKR